MKKFKFIYRPLIVIILVSMSMFVFASCGGKKATTTNKTGAFDQSAMKKQIETSIQSLIDAKTITADQGTKIVTALTANTGGPMGGRPGQKPDANSTPPTDGSATPGDNTNADGTVPAKGAAGGTGTAPGANQGSPFTSALTALVNDKTITQSQADAVTAKLNTLFQGQGQGQRNEGNTDTTNTTS